MAERIKSEDLKFEINFFNGLLKKNPKFFEALVALGDLYTKAGMYHEGLAVDEQLVTIRPDDPTAHYNLACSYSLLKETPKALKALKKAIDCGYRDFRFIERDGDLNHLRKDESFKEYFEQIKKDIPPVSDD